MDAEVRAGLRKLLDQGEYISLHESCKQAAYVMVDRLNTKYSWRRTRGTEMATRSKKDGLQVEVLLRDKNGKYFKPFVFSVEQTEDEILVKIGGEIIYTSKK